MVKLFFQIHSHSAIAVGPRAETTEWVAFPARPGLRGRQGSLTLIRRFWATLIKILKADCCEPTHPGADVDHPAGCDTLMEELGLHGPGIAWRRHLQRKAPESLGRPGRRAANDMNVLYQSKIYQLLRHGCEVVLRTTSPNAASSAWRFPGPRCSQLSRPWSLVSSANRYTFLPHCG